MSCAASAGKTSGVGRLAGGITRLASKRGFYAGTVLGGIGLVGAGLVALARRRRQKSGPGQKLSQGRTNMPGASPFRTNQIVHLPNRSRVKPVSRTLSGAEQCAGCQAIATSKSGPWYPLSGRLYCQDCAPAAALRAGVDLVTPEPAGPSSASANLPGWRQLIGLPDEAQRQPPAYLPAERRVTTQLRASRLRLYAGQNAAGEPVYVEVGNGFVVVRPDLHSPDGVTDTGLAIAPNLTVDASGTQLLEDTSQWHLVHVRSGKTIPGASYAALDQAGLLASILAQVDWNQAEQEMSTAEIRLIGGTVSEYNRVLAGELRARPAASTDGATTDPPPATKPVVRGTDTIPERPGAALVGRLVADRSGGVARVLDVDEKTGVLLLVDSLGQRYELYPDEVRQPADQDFELVRVAQSFDPATRTETTCAGCGQGSHQPGAGQRWYRMARQSFCQVCAARYAAEESYLLDDEITAELEPTPL